jgi:hypothetical protein
VALVLLAGAGLLVQSWWRVQSVSPGFESEGLLTISASLPPGRFDTQEKRDAFFAAALARLRSIPGVQDAATVSRISMTEFGWSSDFAVAGRRREAFGIQVLHARSRRPTRGARHSGQSGTSVYRRGQSQCPTGCAHQ